MVINRAMNISVILPSRNAIEAELNRAIESCLNLGVAVCIHFDHDNEESYSQNHLDNPLVSYTVERVGKVEAMNKALALVTTPYYLYLGDDDWLDAGIIELADVLELHPEFAFAYGKQQYHGSASHVCIPHQYEGDELYSSNIPLNALLYRTDVVRSIGYDDNIHNIVGAGKPEDYDLLLCVHEAGYKGVAVPTQDVVIHYTLSHTREWWKMQQHNKAVTEAFKLKHPKFRGTSL